MDFARACASYSNPLGCALIAWNHLFSDDRPPWATSICDHPGRPTVRVTSMVKFFPISSRTIFSSATSALSSILFQSLTFQLRVTSNQGDLFPVSLCSLHCQLRWYRDLAPPLPPATCALSFCYLAGRCAASVSAGEILVNKSFI